MDGTLTTYTLDIATPLTMVLAESTTGEDPIYYLHGLDLVAQSDGTTTECFGYDGLGSVRQVFDAAGDPVMAQTFDPYGTPYQRTGSDPSRFGFTGEQVDENGLIFLRARYYDPGSGRFLNMDPSRQEVNPYQYAASNPVMYVDPSGLVTICEPLLVAQQIEAYEACITVEKTVEAVAVSTTETVQTSFIDPQVALLILLFAACDDEINTGIQTFNTGMAFATDQAIAGINYNIEVIAFLLNGGDIEDVPEFEVYHGIEEWLVDNPARIEGTIFEDDRNDEETFYFRGTSMGYSGRYPQEGTNVSTDPIVATIFSVHGNEFPGGGVLYVATGEDLAGLTILSGNYLSEIERELIVDTSPEDFARRASVSITSSEARAYAATFGVDISYRIRSPGDIQYEIVNTRRLSESEIRSFVTLARGY